MKENEKTVNQFGKNVKHQRIFVVNDPTMCRIIPSLAMEIGLNESILFMQLEFWISITPDDDTHVRDGKKWIWKSVRDMQDEVFPFWSIDKINRIVNNLLKQKLIFVNTSYNKFSYDKTRWFAINFDTVSKLNSLKVNDFTPTLSQNKTPLYGNADEQNQDVTSTLSQNRTGVSQNKTTIPETTTRDKNNDDSKDLNFLSDDAEKASSLSSFSSAGNEDSGNQLDDDSGNQPDSSALNDLIGMIPEKMRVPVVKNLVSQSLAEKGLCFVRDAIAYTNDRKKVANKDTWQAYRTHLAKCLNGEYGGVSGFFESCQSASESSNAGIGKEKKTVECDHDWEVCLNGNFICKKCEMCLDVEKKIVYRYSDLKSAKPFTGEIPKAPVQDKKPFSVLGCNFEKPTAPPKPKTPVSFPKVRSKEEQLKALRELDTEKKNGTE